MDRWPSFCYRTDLQVKALHQICCLVGPSSSETQLPHLGEPGETEASGTTSGSLQVRSTRTHWGNHPAPLGEQPAPCQDQLSLPQPMTPTWRIAPLSIVLRWRGRLTFTVDHRHEASGLQNSNAHHQSYHKNYFTRLFLGPSAARPLPCPNTGELLANITPLAPHAMFGVSRPMTYNSMGPGRGGSGSLNTDLPSSSVFWGAAARKLWQGEWDRNIMAHNRANTGLGCCILVWKSMEALPRIEGFWL